MRRPFLCRHHRLLSVTAVVGYVESSWVLKTPLIHSGRSAMAFANACPNPLARGHAMLARVFKLAATGGAVVVDRAVVARVFACECGAVVAFSS